MSVRTCFLIGIGMALIASAMAVEVVALRPLDRSQRGRLESLLAGAPR
jgi:hypothetical protein